MNQEVVFVETQRTSELRLREDRYQYMPKKGWAWLQRVCFWFLGRIGCNPFDEVVAYSRHRIDTQNLVKAIHEQHSGLLDMYHAVKAERLLIGSEDFARLMGAPEIQNMMSFHAAYANGRAIFGMKVTVIPWMSGVLIVPRALD